MASGIKERIVVMAGEEYSPKLARCNFESNTCGWITDSCSWERREAGYSTINSDHTTRREEGHVMYMGKRGHVMYTSEHDCRPNNRCMVTPRLHASQLGGLNHSFTISFFYQKDSLSKLTVDIIEEGKQRMLWSIKDDQKVHWLPENTEEDFFTVHVLTAVICSVLLIVCVIGTVIVWRRRNILVRKSRAKQKAVQKFNSAYSSVSEENQCFISSEISKTLNVKFENKIEKNNRDFDRAIHVPFNKLRIANLLGKGAFGEVYLGFLNGIPHHKTELPVAVKKLPQHCTEETKADFFLEILILSNFSHPNIVKFLGITIDGRTMYMLIEFMNRGDLRKYLINGRPKAKCNSGLIGQKDLMTFALDVAFGCQYLEVNGFIHRDLAARNCLLTENEKGLVTKIADFGLARDIMRSNYYKKSGRAMIPVKWMPPEAFQDGIFSSKTDIWAYGVLLWEIFSFGHIPYPGMSNVDVMNFVCNSGRMEPPTNCSDSMYALMLRCWTSDPMSRPEFKDIIKPIQEEIELWQLGEDSEYVLPNTGPRQEKESNAVLQKGMDPVHRTTPPLLLHRTSEGSDIAFSENTETSILTRNWSEDLQSISSS
ncbi:hypothetical protein ScPMuIL_014041 [Solemya velum]